MATNHTLLVATGREVLGVEAGAGRVERGRGLEDRLPTCLAADPREPGTAWCGTTDGGVLRTVDGGRSWTPGGLEGEHVTALAAGGEGSVWAGTEPSRLFRRVGGEWRSGGEIGGLPSAPEWSFPPKPETHHVRWIALHPSDPAVVWVAIEAGALIRTRDGGGSWEDRVPGGPYDTHELAVHPGRPELLRVAAGDGYYESPDGGDRWDRPRRGLEVGYMRSVAIDPGDPGVVLASASSHPRSAYVAGRSDGRVYRRAGVGAWVRVRHGWPERPETIAPLLLPGREPGELWAADERGVHRSADGGERWERVAAFPRAIGHLRGLCLLA